MRRSRFLWSLIALVPALCAGGVAVASDHQDARCAITAIDARMGIVTEKDEGSRRTFRFKVTDATLLKSLAVGQQVFADFRAGKVRLTADRKSQQAGWDIKDISSSQ